MIARRQLPVKQNPQSFLHPRKIAENRRKTQKRCKFNLQTGCGLDRQNDLKWLPLRSSHIQRKNYFKFRVCRALRTAPNAIFTGGVWNEISQSKPDGFDSSLWEGAFGMTGKFATKPQSLRAHSLPLGGAVAQRLRGYKWRSEKSVKAIAPTGAALAFLCFDFFFRIVKGV